MCLHFSPFSQDKTVDVLKVLFIDKYISLQHIRIHLLTKWKYMEKMVANYWTNTYRTHLQMLLLTCKFHPNSYAHIYLLPFFLTCSLSSTLFITYTDSPLDMIQWPTHCRDTKIHVSRHMWMLAHPHWLQKRTHQLVLFLTWEVEFRKAITSAKKLFLDWEVWASTSLYLYMHTQIVICALI